MGENTLLEGISREAAEEAGTVLQRAEKQAEAKRKGLEFQVGAIRKESAAEIEKQLSEIRRRSESSIKSATRRASLKYREELYNRVIKLAEKKLLSQIGTASYPELLAKLIAEGVLGLNRDEAVISFSHLETLDASILQRAAALVKSATGREVILSSASEEPVGGESDAQDRPFPKERPLPKERPALSSQGISVASKDGRISFNNQIQTRFRRYDQEIKKIVYDELENKE